MGASRIVSHHDLQKDDELNALITIDAVHSEIHEGDHYTAVAVDNALADNETLVVYFKTPADIECHAITEVSAPLAGEFEIRESATCSLSGTVVTPKNNDRNSANVSTVEVRHTPTVTASGTLLDYAILGAGSGPKAPGGSMASREEWILKKSTVYLFRFTSAANSNEASIAVRWYEE